MNEWMNEWCIYIALFVYCCTPKALYNHVGGGGGGLSSTTTSVYHTGPLTCVYHTSNCTKKFQTFFHDVVRLEVGCVRWSMFQEVGGLYGVSQRGGVIGVQGSLSLGEKLLSSLAEWALMLRYRLPDGRSWKRLWEGLGGVLHDTICFAGASCKENVQDGGERGTDDLCSCVHCPLEGLALCCTTEPHK